MKKNDKKYYLKLTGVLLSLVAIVGGMFWFIDHNEKKNLVQCIVANEVIGADYEITQEDVNTKFTVKTVHADAIGGLANKDKLVDLTEITDYQTKYAIAKDTIITFELLEDKGTVDEDPNKVQLGEAKYVTVPLEVPVKNLSNGTISQGDTIVIYGVSELVDATTKERTTWYGPISEKAEVIKVFGDLLTDKAVNVTFKIKAEEYNKLLLVLESGTLYYISGDVTDLTDTDANISANLLNIFSHTGEIDFIGTKYSDKEINFIEPHDDEKIGFNLSWTGFKPDEVSIKHYRTLNQESSYFGIYRINNELVDRRINYDLSTGIYNFIIPEGQEYMFDEDGYYDITFARKEICPICKGIGEITQPNSEGKNEQVKCDTCDADNTITVTKNYKFFALTGELGNVQAKIGYYNGDNFVETGIMKYMYNSDLSRVTDSIDDLFLTKEEFSDIDAISNIDYNELDPENEYKEFYSGLKYGNDVIKYKWSFEENMFNDRKNISAPAKDASVEELIKLLIELTEDFCGTDLTYSIWYPSNTSCQTEDSFKDVFNTIKKDYTDNQIKEMIAYYKNIKNKYMPEESDIVDGDEVSNSLTLEMQEFRKAAGFVALQRFGFERTIETNAEYREGCYKLIAYINGTTDEYYASIENNEDENQDETLGGEVDDELNKLSSDFRVSFEFKGINQFYYENQPETHSGNYYLINSYIEIYYEGMN